MNTELVKQALNDRSLQLEDGSIGTIDTTHMDFEQEDRSVGILGCFATVEIKTCGRVIHNCMVWDNGEVQSEDGVIIGQTIEDFRYYL